MTHSFFLGSKSPDGFRSFFSDIISADGYYTYILKGGPGTGKSTLIKKIASVFSNEDHDVYYCSSDTSSLDAVVLSERKIIIADGTSPHEIDPNYPGISQNIIDLGTAFDKKKLRKNKDKILDLFEKNRSYHIRAGRYIQAGASLNQNAFGIASAALLKEKTEKYACRLLAGLLEKKENCESCISPRTLSAFSSLGYLTLPLPEDYHITLIKDNDTAAADCLIRKLSEKSAELGYNSYISYCPAFSGEICEHLIIPEIKAAFLTSDHINKLDIQCSNTVKTEKFYNKKLVSDKKVFASFNKKVVSSINSEISVSMTKALDIHNELEKYYISSLNTKILDEITEDLISEIKNPRF